MQNKFLKKSVSISDKSDNDGGSINSPLQRFVRAKKRINQTFEEIFRYLKECRIFVLDCEISGNDTRKYLQQIDDFLSQTISINEILQRDHMKVAFFGRTSNGKSTVVNAMLSDRILPAGIGHTTNCFVAVLGTEGNEAYMEDTSSENPEKRSVESLQQLAHALHNQKLDSSSLLKVHWPHSRCPLLKDDVVFVDSPGIDVSPDLDNWIDSHCLDADVFVLVVNSESTINHTEKSFFHKVNEKLSKPSIFILNNRWDASADDDPEMIKLVRQQHEQRAKEFLVDELKCVNQSDVADRIFFVSALETLRYRISRKMTSNIPKTQSPISEDGDIQSLDFRNGKIARRQEFEDFEAKFKECISKSAISTKFCGHSATGSSIAREMVKMMEAILHTASSQREQCIKEREETEQTLNQIKTQFQLKKEQIKKRIDGISEEVELQVTKAMSEEIRRLGNLVSEFDYPFHAHPGFLKNYKQELHMYIENGLGTNLKARCTAPLCESIEEYKAEMQDEIHSLIPASTCTSSIIFPLERTKFEVSYEFDVANLCSDFQEDITFKFSMGWSNLISKYVSHRNPRLAILLGAPVKQSFRSFNDTLIKPVRSEEISYNGEDVDGKSMKTRHYSCGKYGREMLEYQDEEDELTVAVLQGLGSLGSTSAMSIVVAASLIWRTVGWKLIACVSVGYLGMYIYERVMWTNAAKEKMFKSQFVDYATERLKLIVSYTSKGCSNQIEQELLQSFVQLTSLVESSESKVKDKLASLNEKIEQLQAIETSAKLYRNKASWVENELHSFMKDFNLKVSNHSAL